MISDLKCKEILASLSHEGELIILGEGSSRLVCSASKNGLAALIIENEVESLACKQYLLNNGAKQFLNHEQVMEHYGWDGEAKITPSS